MTNDPDKARRVLDDRPPWFRTWTGVYGVVLAFLGLLVLVFYLLTRSLS